jgi:two-component system, OmpR family, response regulator PrrA
VAAEATEPGTRLAIIDRDADLVDAVRESAARRGWDSHALSRPLGGRQLAGMGVDALVFDPALVDPDPWTWVRDLAARLPELALVVCTARSTVDERIEALALGIDDWVVKPADPDELVARVGRAIDRVRGGAERPPDAAPMRAGELEIDRRGRQVFAAGVNAGLTRREFEVLAPIVEADGAVVARDQIFLRVWGYAMGRSDRSVDVYVGKVRAKLAGVSPAYAYIHTHHRVGYRFEARRLEAGAGELVGEGT